MFANFYILITAQLTVQAFLDSSVFAPAIRSCRQSALQLLTSIENVINNAEENTIIQPYQAAGISSNLQQFKTALLAEIGVFPSYFVTQKGGFDTLTLLESGQLLFPPDLQVKVPEAIFDVQQAGKALAFELPTSAGFHVFRAVETVLRKYYSHVTSGAAAPKVRTIGVYVRQIRAKNLGDEVILSTLEQLAKLHRNPVIHPEAVLTPDEAISTMGIARSAITAMLAVLPVVAPTTASP